MTPTSPTATGRALLAAAWLMTLCAVAATIAAVAAHETRDAARTALAQSRLDRAVDLFSAPLADGEGQRAVTLLRASSTEARYSVTDRIRAGARSRGARIVTFSAGDSGVISKTLP